MSEKREDDVSNTSSAYDTMKPRWELIDTLLGGTEAMRAAGEKYLPRYSAEAPEVYNSRLAKATLLNRTEQTLGSLVGTVFEDEVTLDEDVPAQVRDFEEDVDSLGSDLTTFAHRWFRTAMAKAYAGVMVEIPPPAQKADGTPQTLADDAAQGRRPYWCLLKPESIIAMYTEVVDGTERITHIRLLEETIERVGFSEALVRRIRVLEPGTWALYKGEPAQANQKQKFVLEDAGNTGLDFVPVVVYYTQRDGVGLGKPPLTDLAYLNVEHWQSKSDQRNCLSVARFPILAGSGVEVGGGEDGPDQEVAIGPNRWLTTSSPDGKWYYVEHTGAALNAGQTDLDKLEEQMASFGAQFLAKKPGGQTATARALDSAEAMSDLEAMALLFKDALETLLEYTALVGKYGTDGGTVTMRTQFDQLVTNPEDLKALQEARRGKDISRIALLDEYKRRGILSAEYDAEEDQGLIDEEAPAGGDLLSMFPGMKPVPGAPSPGKPPQNGPVPNNGPAPVPAPAPKPTP